MISSRRYIATSMRKVSRRVFFPFPFVGFYCFEQSVSSVQLKKLSSVPAPEMSTFQSLWQASLNATKKALTWNVENWIPPSERYIFNFNSKEELKKWHLYSDSEYGGMSSAYLEITDTGNGPNGTGQAKTFCIILDFDGFLDLEPYDSLALKIKGDGRTYISTIYTENWVDSPAQQEDNSNRRFCTKRQLIPLACYLPTWRGNFIDAEMEMNPSLPVDSGGGVPGAITRPGDFKLEINWIKALRTLYIPLGYQKSFLATGLAGLWLGRSPELLS